jgi:hypothetical protein
MNTGKVGVVGAGTKGGGRPNALSGPMSGLACAAATCNLQANAAFGRLCRYLDYVEFPERQFGGTRVYGLCGKLKGFRALHKFGVFLKWSFHSRRRS